MKSIYKKVIFPKKVHYLWVNLLFFCFFAYTSCHPSDSISPDKARLSGKFSKEIYLAMEDTSVQVQFASFTHFTHGYAREIPLNDDGTFVVDVPVVCPTIGQIGLDGYYIAVYLMPGEETKFEVMYDPQTRKRKLNMTEGIGFSEEDLKTCNEFWNNIFYSVQHTWRINSEMQPEEYDKHIIANLEELKRRINNNTESLYDMKQLMLSYDMKQFVKQQIDLFYLIALLNYDNVREEYNLLERPLQKESDFSVLKYFHLNDSTIFYGMRYGSVFQKILANKVLNIPPIGNMDIKNWLKEVKLTLANLIGSDTGFFYDLLVANAYFRQLDVDITPLSEEQKNNIQSYFRNQSYIDLLSSESEKIEELICVKRNETPNVPKEKLMDAILSEYKGNVVVVDFWATWCGPCINAMKDIKEIKQEMKDKNVIFVYITNPSSPLKRWYEISHDVGGEHYFLTMEEWNYILKKRFHFNGIPSYLIYDATGVLKNKLTEGYPGTKEMRRIIEELLP
jgi:thiol-disulfide isomerase/thioredoxin